MPLFSTLFKKDFLLFGDFNLKYNNFPIFRIFSYILLTFLYFQIFPAFNAFRFVSRLKQMHRIY